MEPTIDTVTGLVASNPAAAARAYVKLVETVLDGPANVRITPDPEQAEKVVALGCRILPTLAPTGGPAAGAFSALAGLAAAHPHADRLLTTVIDAGLNAVHDVAFSNPMAAHGIHVTVLEHSLRLKYRVLPSVISFIDSHKANIAPDRTPPHLRFRDLTSNTPAAPSQEKEARRLVQEILFRPGLGEYLPSPQPASARPAPALG